MSNYRGKYDLANDRRSLAKRKRVMNEERVKEFERDVKGAGTLDELKAVLVSRTKILVWAP